MHTLIMSLHFDATRPFAPSHCCLTLDILEHAQSRAFHDFRLPVVGQLVLSVIPLTLQATASIISDHTKMFSFGAMDWPQSAVIVTLATQLIFWSRFRLRGAVNSSVGHRRSCLVNWSSERLSSEVLRHPRDRTITLQLWSSHLRVGTRFHLQG